MLTSEELDRRIHKLHVRLQRAKRPVLGCGLVWHPDTFVAGWRPGRVHNRLQLGAVGLSEWGHALACVAGLGRCGC